MSYIQFHQSSENNLSVIFSEHDACLSDKIMDLQVLTHQFKSNIDIAKIESESKIYINLHSSKLSQIPDIVFEQSELNDLIASDNQINEISDQFSKLRNLKCLILSSNLIEEIPIVISQLLNLEQLDLRYNFIRTLYFSLLKGVVPASIANLRNLKELMLCYNLIDVIHNEAFQMLNLLKLTLKGNLITQLPFSFRNIIETLAIFEIDWFRWTLPELPEASFLSDFIKNRLIDLARRHWRESKPITFYSFVNSLSKFDFDPSCHAENILFQLVCQDSIGIIRVIVKDYPELLLKENYDGQSPLIFAYRRRNKRSFLELLQYYQPFTLILNKLLLIVVKQLDVDTLQLIINKVNHQYLSEEESSSKIAARSNVFHFMMSTVFGENHSKIGSFFTNVDCNHKNFDKWTPLHLATKAQSISALNYAIHKRFKFKFDRKGGRWKETCLHIAASLGFINVLQILSLAHANPFIPNLLNKTAKQVSICSAVVIKSMRKYELEFIRMHIIMSCDCLEKKQSKEFNNAFFTEISKALRYSIKIKSIMKELQTIKCCTLQERFLLIVIIKMIQNRRIWQYSSELPPSFIMILNTAKIQQQKCKVQYESNMTTILATIRENIRQIPSLVKKGEPFSENLINLRQQLSNQMIYDIANYWQISSSNEHYLYEQIMSLLGYYQIESQEQNVLNSRTTILQYEQFQQRNQVTQRQLHCTHQQIKKQTSYSFCLFPKQSTQDSNQFSFSGVQENIKQSAQSFAQLIGENLDSNFSDFSEEIYYSD